MKKRNMLLKIKIVEELVKCMRAIQQILNADGFVQANEKSEEGLLVAVISQS